MTDATTHYADVFKAWAIKQLGPKPTADQLDTVHKLNARPGKQALAIAMALRDCGVTGGQIIIACGAPQLNKMRGYITDHMLKRLPAPKSPEGHTVYRLELTAKGKQRVERTAKAEAKAIEAGAATGEADTAKPKKAASKPRKGAQRKPKADGTTANATAVVPAPEASPQGEPQVTGNEPQVTGEADNAAQATV